MIRNDATSLQKIIDQINEKTLEKKEPNYTYSFDLLGIWTQLLKNRPKIENILSGQILNKNRSADLLTILND